MNSLTGGATKKEIIGYVIVSTVIAGIVGLFLAMTIIIIKRRNKAKTTN
jgi:hypothetical protein